MTRIIIFSDLHANWEALLTLQQAELRPDAILYLGDLVGYGPDPKLCLDAVRAAATYAIGGWHDRAVGGDARRPTGQPTELLQASWAHARGQLSTIDRNYLTSLPTDQLVELAGVRFYLTRLQADDLEAETSMLITASQARLRESFGAIEADIILLGGSHIPALRQIDGRLIVSPGSLGQPRYGVPDPTFAAWEDGRVQIHHLHYHPEPTIRKLSLLNLAPDDQLSLQQILQSGRPD